MEEEPMSAKSVKKNNQKIIGLTGNIASGKSTALKIISKLGYDTIDSDDIVKTLWKDRFFVTALSNAFNLDLFQTEQKNLFVKQVFDDTNTRKKLEAIIHPFVFEAIEKYLTTHDDHVIIDMPLLFEVGYESKCDAVILITIDETIQIDRLSKRGLNDENALKRIKAQLPQHEKMAKTKYHVDGTLNKKFFKKQLKHILEGIISDDKV